MEFIWEPIADLHTPHILNKPLHQMILVGIILILQSQQILKKESDF
jgi:hypothetical protein